RRRRTERRAWRHPTATLGSGLATCGGSALQRRPESFGGMRGPSPGQMIDLLAARHAGRDDVGLGGRRLYGQGEPAGAEPRRKFVMLTLEAERPGHPAAASLYFAD